MSRKLNYVIFTLFLFVAGQVMTGCSSSSKMEGTSWGLVTTWNQKGQYHGNTINLLADGKAEYLVDSSSTTFLATWTEIDGTVTVNVTMSGKNPVFKGSHDRTHFDGTMSDNTGDSGTFVGNKK